VQRDQRTAKSLTLAQGHLASVQDVELVTF